MTAEILVNCALGETRTALLEDGAVKEYYVERDEDRSVVGSIYRGRVTRVLPGMQAAFVQVGLERAAFLYVDDVVTPEDLKPAVEGEDAPEPKDTPRPSINSLLREGQEITVQVVKAPLGTKGARVTTYLTIPGRYVVYMPTVKKIGVSRRITQEGERQRLKDIVVSNQAEDEGGFIIRTVCEGLEGDEISKDMDFVRSLWSDITDKSKGAPVPSLIQPDFDIILRSTRDMFTDKVACMRLDSAEHAQRVKDLLNRFAPHLAERTEVYDRAAPLFEAYGVEQALEEALLRQFHLKSGISIVVDEAEALTAIDVNTGRYVGTHDLEATILQTNLLAADAIADQIRLRNLGGIIIIDFIDMLALESREQVHDAFVLALGRDRAKTHALNMSGLGLLEMTRKRVSPSLGRTLLEACPYCDGSGRVRSKETVCLQILRETARQASLHGEGDLLIAAMPEVVAMLTDKLKPNVETLEKSTGRNIIIEARADLHQEVFQVSVRPSSIGTQA